MKHWKLASLLLAGTVGLAGCADDLPTTATPDDAAVAARGPSADQASYIVIAKGNELPRGLAKQVRNAGGTITNTVPEIGMAVVVSDDPKFAERAERIAGIQSVAPDITLQ